MLKSKAAFRLIGDFDPDEITAILDLRPTFITRKGALSRLNEVSSHSVWGLSCDSGNDATLSAQIGWLGERFAAKKDALEHLTNLYAADIFCSVTHGEQDGMTIEHAHLSWLKKFKINLEFSFIALFD